MTPHVTEWIDDTGTRRQKEHPTEARAEQHAANLVRQGIKQVVVYAAAEVRA